MGKSRQVRQGKMKNTITKLFLIALVIVISSSIVNAVIIESTTANQNVFKDGDLITIIIQANAENLQVTADFSAVDSGFNPGSVLVEPDGMVYTISYPITFANTRGDSTYNSIITVYDPATSTTSTVTYGITLANTGQRLSAIQDLVLTVSDEAMISVKSGTIQVCSSTKCTTFTQAEYDATRNIMISSGTVSLSGLTYNQIVSQIQNQTNAYTAAQLKDYLTQLVTIKGQLDAGLYDLKAINKDMVNNSINFKNETEKIIAQGSRNNLIALIGVFIMIAAGLYIIYLRTETTWFIGPK